MGMSNAAAARKEKLRLSLRQYKEDHPCFRCGGFFRWPCMDFHHLYDDKSSNIGTMINSGRSLKAINAEIAKCELLCANCHRLITAGLDVL